MDFARIFLPVAVIILCFSAVVNAQVGAASEDIDTVALSKDKNLQNMLRPVKEKIPYRSVSKPLRLAATARILQSNMPNAYKGDDCIPIPNAYRGDLAVQIPNVFPIDSMLIVSDKQREKQEGNEIPVPDPAQVHENGKENKNIP